MTKLSIKKQNINESQLEEIKQNSSVVSENQNNIVIEAKKEKIEEYKNQYHALESINE